MLFLETTSFTQELFGGVIRGYKNDTLFAGFTGPFGYDGSFRRLWIPWRRNIGGAYLQSVAFYNYIDISGTDTTQWKILKVYFFVLFSSSFLYLTCLVRISRPSVPICAIFP